MVVGWVFSSGMTARVGVAVVRVRLRIFPAQVLMWVFHGQPKSYPEPSPARGLKALILAS